MAARYVHQHNDDADLGNAIQTVYGGTWEVDVAIKIVRADSGRALGACQQAPAARL